jgi:serine/threonine protein kinase
MDYILPEIYRLLSHRYAFWVLLVVGLLIAYKFLGRFNLSVRMPGRAITMDEVLAKVLGARYREGKIETAVWREKKKGNLLGAGRLYEDAGKLDKAIELYTEGQEFYAAATALEKMGKLERAAELFVQAGDYKKAAQVFSASGKHLRAAALFQERGNNLEAARLYAQGQAWDKASELYEKGGYPAKAAEAYEKLGNFVKAAECYERHFMENVSYSTTYSSTAVAPEQKSALLAGRLYERAGDLKRAFQIFTKGSYHKEAAQTALNLGQPVQAAELFMRAEDHGSAADAYEKAGDPVKAANLRGEVALKGERVAEAAGFFVKGQDYLRAAELYESIGMLAEAAGAYEAGDSWGPAGSVYVRAGDKERAAAAYEKAGDFETAAKFYGESGNSRKAMALFERAGQTFQSGMAAAKANDFERAIGLLQRVPPSDENYRAATERLVQIFLDLGKPALALERVQRALAGQTIGAGNIDLFYLLGVTHEALGQRDQALEVLKRVLSEDLQYKDAEARVARIESGTAAPQASDRLGKYKLLAKIGQGAMGEVHRAHDPGLNRDVALKMVSTGLATSPEHTTRFKREAQSAAQLNHPNIVTVFDFGEEAGKIFMAMELLEGQDLRRLIGSPALGDPARVIDLTLQICEGLEYAHSKNVIHRDLKPGNIRVLPNGRIKILDFGLARLGASEMTQTGVVMGTPNYMSPEQAQGATADARSDIFAVGALMYEMLTGQKAFDGESVHSVINQVATREPTPLAQRRSDLTPSLINVVEKALAKDPKGRFQTAREMRAALGAARAATQGGASSAMQKPSEPRPTAEPPTPAAPPPKAAVAPPGGKPAAKAPRFVKCEQRGPGALGSVWRGEDPIDRRSVALRLLPTELLKAPGAMQAIAADLKAAAGVAHPNLAKVMGFMELEGQSCVVSEFVPGRDLSEGVAAGRRMPFMQVLSLGKVLAQVLGAIHARQLVHGSIQPSNVMVAQGVVKLTDLGLGRLAHAVTRAVDYCAPEKRLDVGGDIYALAALLYHLLTGIHPKTTPAGSALQMPGKVVPGVPPSFDQLLFQNLQTMPEVRCSSADEFQKILSRMVKLP